MPGKKILLFACAVAFGLVACGCSKQSPSVSPPSPTTTPSSAVVAVPPVGSSATNAPPPRTQPIEALARKVHKPLQDGTAMEQNELAAVDFSHADQGYVMTRYSGSVGKVKMQLQGPDKITYTYTLGSGWETFPLTGGKGDYTINILENPAGTSYISALSLQFSANMEGDTLPYLYPNQYVNFSEKSLAVGEADRLSLYASTPLEFVSLVYNYTMETLEYDYDKADKVTSGEIQSGYTPNVDEIMKTKKGICFDYAAIMATMLRTHGIPTRLEVGYAGEIYHAWVSVYIPDVGWVNNLIYFDGKTWKRMDPTFSDTSEQGEDTQTFITTDSNYTTRFKY